jgi:hypothetical protein
MVAASEPSGRATILSTILMSTPPIEIVPTQIPAGLKVCAGRGAAGCEAAAIAKQLPRAKKIIMIFAFLRIISPIRIDLI